MGASEIDLTGVRHAIEIRRVVKACAGKIGSLLERSSRKISFALESRVCKRNVYERSTLPVECDAPYEAGLVKFGLGTEHRPGKVGRVTESRSGEVGLTPEFGVGKVGLVAENCGVEVGFVTEGHASEDGFIAKVSVPENHIVTEDCSGEEGIIPKGRVAKDSKFSKSGAFKKGPFSKGNTMEKSIITEGCTAKVGPCSESHWHAFFGPPPIVPRVFALQSKGDKKFLIVFFFCHQISVKSLLLKIAASFMPCAAKFCAAPSSRSTTARARRTWAVWPSMPSMALRIEPPVVATSSIMSTSASARKKPSTLSRAPCSFCALRTKKASTG